MNPSLPRTEGQATAEFSARNSHRRNSPDNSGGGQDRATAAEVPGAAGASASRTRWEFWAVRALLITFAAAVCYALAPGGPKGVIAAGAGFAVALLILAVELQLRRAALSALLGGAAGMILGLLAAVLATAVVSRTAQPEPAKSFLEYGILCVFGYLGLSLGAHRGRDLRPQSLGEWFSCRTVTPETPKFLDTSVLIDGRIGDICEARFLDGAMIVPQFVLRELQMVADSPDSLKRQRGRRGLDVVERIQKLPGVQVRIVDDETSLAGDVDQKLIELARRTGGKIVTNDFNLNKVATVQGISVLNVNQLANALKPAVLPGEAMRVYVLREGKEANQGVAYLDDGTMVVVDGARRHINKHINILVTSVHQTTAGKMIFARTDERTEQGPPALRHAAAAGAGRSESVAGSGAGIRMPNAAFSEPRPIFPESEAD
jgi:uncharacterized protein YacL